MKIRIKIQGTLMLLGLAAIVIFSNFLSQNWKNEAADEISDIVGMGLILFGFLFRIAARGYKEEKCCNGHFLVQDGPYAIIRNPMYFGTFIIGTGIVAMLLNLWVFVIFVAGFFMIYIPQMKKEERVLLERFGQTYKEYCDITPKYIPRMDYLIMLHKHISLKYFWIKKEIASMIPVIIAVAGIEIWEDVKLFGRRELLAESLELVFIILLFSVVLSLFLEKKTKIA
jgi:protein-S-isoprenylcysteine O-methyltransferase Ste14